VSVLCELCQKRHTFMKRDICITNNCKRVLHMWKETYNNVSRVMYCVWAVQNMSKETYIHEKGPVKDTCKRVLHMWKETYNRANRVRYWVGAVQTMSNEIYIYEKETCKRNLNMLKTTPQRSVSKETSIHEKRSVKGTLKETCKRDLHMFKTTFDRVGSVVCCVRALQNVSKKTYLHGKRPVNGTCIHEKRPTRGPRIGS